MQTGRCGRICFFLNLIVAKISSVCGHYGWRLLWRGTLHIMNVLVVIEQICRALLLKYIYILLFRPTDGGAYFFLTLLLLNLNAYRVCACSLSVAQQVLLKTRNRAPKPDLWVPLRFNIVFVYICLLTISFLTSYHLLST